MNRYLRSAGACALAASLILGAPAASAMAADPAPEARASLTNIPVEEFGQHVPLIISAKDWPTITTGSIRLWDTGVQWRDVNKQNGKYNWAILDAAVIKANEKNATVMYVLGSTPQWAAKNTKVGIKGPGSASPPKTMDIWNTWVKTVAKRYKGQIDYYQIWNEANLQNFWTGSPQEMAQMTISAAKIIKAQDPNAKVVAASTTLRLSKDYNRFFPPYLAGLKKGKWPVQAFGVSSYPAADGGPDERIALIQTAQQTLAKAGAPNRPLMDMEVNYGLAGPGAITRPNIFTNDLQAAWASRTYIDSARLGVSNTYWYSWVPAGPLLGVTVYNGTPAATAINTTAAWLVGGSIGSCTTSGAVTTCPLTNGGKTYTLAWASGSNTASGSVAAPAAGQVCAVNNNCTPIAAGASVPVTISPVRIG